MPNDRETETITSDDVAVLDLSTGKVTKSTLGTHTFQSLQKGMQVVFVDPRLNTHPMALVDAPLETNVANLAGKLAMVIAIEFDRPGKQVALCFQDPIEGGHSCDGRVPHGHGAYALPSHLYSPEAWEAHKGAAKIANEEQAKIDDMLAGFVKVAPPAPAEPAE